MSSSISQSITIRVLVASTGFTYKISLLLSELTINNIRQHLAAAIPPNDQILLLGPPFKVPKDSTLQSEEVLRSLHAGDLEDDPIAGDTNDNSSNNDDSDNNNNNEASIQTKNLLAISEKTGARRLFLFSKQSLSQSAPDPPPCILAPTTLHLPTEVPGPSPLNIGALHNSSASSSSYSSTPLHQALTAYERQFMLYLEQGRVLADGADARYSACRTCVQEQTIMARALRAAVSNLSDHYNGAARTRTEFTNIFSAKTAVHDQLLQKFEANITNLAQIPLHPALVSSARASGRIIQTLLDTVPVEKERAWAQQCYTSHQRLTVMFKELDSAFVELGTPASREEEVKLDLMAERDIQSLWETIEGSARQIRDRQAQRVERLTSDHGQVVQLIFAAISADSGGGEEAHEAFRPLREMSNSSRDVVPSMITDDATLSQLMQEVANSKTRAMRRMKVRLREVSISQSSIQRVHSSVAILRDALAQQCENMLHLEHVTELPDSYRDFLSEVRRRRAYCYAVTSSSTAMMERLASMRADEVKARERFLRGSGRHLMPSFFDIFVPTLATPPPLFTPQLPAMVELDTLPNIGLPDDDDEGGQQQSAASEDATMQGAEQHGVNSNNSSLTSESRQPPPQQSKHRADEAIIGASTTTTAQETMSSQHNQQQEQLIVSANEHSNNLNMDPTGRVVEDAEHKTLAYENAILRQALERLGGKPPRVYIEENQGTMNQLRNKEITKLTEDLMEAQQESQSLKEKFINIQSSSNSSIVGNTPRSDKISHSSFNIGDVGLFMPTGRGSGGKRTYLAFHTNCPHRYLSTDCVKGAPDFVLGRIVYQEELIAGDISTDANPYSLHVGTKFWILTVEVLNKTNPT